MNIPKERVFLATTALESHWDASLPIRFLGPWCASRIRRSLPEQSAFLQSPLPDARASIDAYERVRSTYEGLLPRLSGTLEKARNERFSDRAWRVQLGPWLMMFVSVLYDRWLHLDNALRAYPSWTTIGSSEFRTAPDTLSFACWAKEDSFNLQIFTSIFACLGHEIPKKAAVSNDSALYTALTTPRSRMSIFASTVHRSLFADSSRSVFFQDTYFPLASIGRMMIRNPRRWIPLRLPRLEFPQAVADLALRKNLAVEATGASVFERLTASLVMKYLPICFLEGAPAVRDSVAYFRPAAILTANAWYYDEAFKFLAASAVDQGTKLFGIQHGGNYGSLESHPSEEHERTIVDHYYTWGWKGDRAKPMPAPPLMRRVHRNPDTTGWLWVGTYVSRYTVQLPETPALFESYLAWQARFLRALPPKTRTRLRFRPHREDGGWGIVERLHEIEPTLAIEPWSTPFLESLARCRLYVCDHLSTTFLQALSADVPTLLFWNPSTTRLRSSAQAAYDDLKAHGILHDSPESAATTIASISDRIEIWWKDPDRRACVRRFCHRFARVGSESEWIEEFSGLRSIPEQRRPTC